MFRPSCRSSSPFSLTDLDMWDTKSRFTAQTSAWCGMATVSGSGFLSKVSTSTSANTGGFRQNDPGLRRWQSLSHLAPGGATRSFPSSPGAEIQASRENNFRQAEVVQWLQDAHEHMDNHLDRLRARDTQLSYNTTTAQFLNMNHKQLSEAMSTLEQEKEAIGLPQFDKNQQRRELHEKVLKLEKDLVQMRSTLDRGSRDQPTKKTPGSLSKTLTVSREDWNRQEKQEVDEELCKLREGLREAEKRAKTQEEERNQALQKLQASAETQRTLLSQIEEMNQKLSCTMSNHSEVQEQLSEANNKISQACLEKAILSTQVLKLEDNIKELKAKLTWALSDKDQLIQKADLHQRAQVVELHQERAQPDLEGCKSHEHQANTESHNHKQDQQTALMDEKSQALREVNEKLTCELDMIKQKLEISQSQLQELTAERVINTKQIRDLEANRSELITQIEELQSKTDQGECEMKEKCCQLRESIEVLELEKQKLQDQCLCLEAELLEKEEKLHLLEKEYQQQDAVRARNIEELKAVASHWTEKWQKVALTLQATQEELKELMNSRNERQCDSLLRDELDTCKRELELERSRSQALLHRYKDEGGAAVQTQDKETVTDLSESSLLWEPTSDWHGSHKKSPQVCIQSNEVQMLREKLSEKEKELREKEDAFMSLERLRETEKTEAQIKVSALELKLRKRASEDSQDGDGHSNVSLNDHLKTQLEESRKRASELQTLKQLYSVRFVKKTCPSCGDERNEEQMPHLQVKDDKPPAEGRKDKTVHPVNLEADQQRRMVTEQLKSLFKEREGKEVGKVENTPAAAPTETAASQDWTPTSKATVADRWGWQQSSGLMPVFEEDEEAGEEDEEEPAEEDHAEESLHNQRGKMSAMRAEISHLNTRNENLLQAVRFKLPIQDLHTTAEKGSDKPLDIEVSLPAHGSDELVLQKRPTSIYPDGIFQAQLVDIYSPDEDEEEGEDGE